jgi:hypothetical protein
MNFYQKIELTNKEICNLVAKEYGIPNGQYQISFLCTKISEQLSHIVIEFKERCGDGK